MSQVERTKPRAPARGTPLADQDRAALKNLVELVGEREAAHRLGVGRHTLARALGGLGLYPPTAFMIRQRMADAGGKSDPSPDR